MSEQSAIICLPDDRDATGLKKPLMLQAMSGSPLLSWMVRLMRDSGYTDFLLSCDDEFRDAALACFPASAVTVTGRSRTLPFFGISSPGLRISFWWSLRLLCWADGPLAV